jgi:hypothetical protein
MEQWAAGQFQGEGKEDTYILNAAAQGEWRGYQRLIDLDFAQFEETMEDE